MPQNLQKLSELVGFKTHAHKKLTARFGRTFLDFSRFIDDFRKSYDRRGAIYVDIRAKFPDTHKEIEKLIDELT